MGKKIVVITITFLLFFGILPLMTVPVKAFSGAGSGTVGDPYQITNKQQLNETRDALGAYYILMNDIDLTGSNLWNAGAGFIPIGTSATRFTGGFNGNDHAIYNLYINRPTTDYIGLFGYTSYANIRNLNLYDATVTGRGSTGSLIGRANYGNITWDNSYDCTVQADWQYTGGLIGLAYRQYSLANCEVTGTVLQGGEWDCVGGVVGYLGGTFPSSRYMDSCSFTGDVTGDYSSVGGLVGYAEFFSIHNSYADADVKGNTWTGGLLGCGSYDGVIWTSHSTGTVTREGSVAYYEDYFGGLVGGTGDVDINVCYSTSDVNDYDLSEYVGGLVGYFEDGTATDCYARGSVYGNDYVGGLCGYVMTSNVVNCYSTGFVDSHSTHEGGLIGDVSSSAMANCYWDIDTSDQTTDPGEPASAGRNTNQMTYDYDGYDPPCVGLYEDWGFGGGEGEPWYHDYGDMNDGYPLHEYSPMPTYPIVWVDDDADPGWYDGNHVETITEAVLAVEDSGTIYVYNGNYDEQVMIDKSVDLIGLEDSVIFENMMILNADYINISGFSFHPWTDYAITNLDSGYLPVNHIHIFDNSFYCPSSVIDIQEDVSYIEIDNNTIEDFTYYAIIVWSYGSDISIHHNTIDGGRCAIEFSGDDSVIFNNTITNAFIDEFSDYAQLDVWDSENVLIYNNIISAGTVETLLIETTPTSDHFSQFCYDNHYWFQSFTITTGGYVDKVSFYMRHGGVLMSPFDLYVAIRDNDGIGPDLISTNISTDIIGTGWDWKEIMFYDDVYLPPGQYTCLFGAPDGHGSNYIEFRDNISNPYSGGMNGYSSNYGVSWASDPNYDILFRLYGHTNSPGGDYCGIGLGNMNNVVLHSNRITGFNRTGSFGLYIWETSDEIYVYNNYFANRNNAYDENVGPNWWNTTKTLGTNIVGGPYIGGNYWSDYNGADTTGDWIGDTYVPYVNNYNLSGGDYLPLIIPEEKRHDEIPEPPPSEPQDNETIIRIPQPELPKYSPPAFTVPEMYQLLHATNLSNSDAEVTVMVIDSGVIPITYNNIKLNKISAIKSISLSNQYDENGHGTWVNYAVAYMLQTKIPHAKQISYRVFGSDGICNSNDFVKALETAKQMHVDIVSISAGVLGTADDSFVRACEDLRNNGIIVVCAAGNFGPSPGSIASPGISDSVIAVSASDPIETGQYSTETHMRGVLDLRDDLICPWSSRGPIAGIIKPDVTAPGESIMGPWLYEERLLSGTSMATPLVSGGIALVYANNKFEIDIVRTLYFWDKTIIPQIFEDAVKDSCFIKGNMNEWGAGIVQFDHVNSNVQASLHSKMLIAFIALFIIICIVSFFTYRHYQSKSSYKVPKWVKKL